MGRDARKERGQMGSGFRQDQSLPETPLHPKLASSGDTDSGRGAGRTRPAGGRTGVHIGLSLQHTPCLGHPWLRRELSAGLMEGGVGASGGSVPTLATPVLPPEVCSTPITPVPPSPTSSGTATAPPSALAPPQAHLVLGKNKTTLPGASATFPTTAWKDAVSLGPPGAGFYPCPPWKLPGQSHRRPLLIHWTCICSPVITRLPHGLCAHLPGPALHCPSRRIKPHSPGPHPLAHLPPLPDSGRTSLHPGAWGMTP